MAKKEISVFSISFLDLLSGALAAVIILFVVVPKMTAEQIDAAETLDRLEVQIHELEELIELARNSIPAELYEQIQEQIQNLNETISELREQIKHLTEQLHQCEDVRLELEERLVETERQLQEAMQRIETMSEQRLEQSSGIGQTLFGVNAKFSIVITWADDLDVDLHIVNRKNDERVWWKNLNSDWGNILADIRNRRSNEDIYELFYQKEIIPGNYDIYYHVYTEVSQAVNIDGYIVMFPFKHNEFKIDIPMKTIRNSQGVVKIGTVSVTQNSFSFQNH